MLTSPSEVGDSQDVYSHAPGRAMSKNIELSIL